MRKIFDIDSPLMSFLSQLCDLVSINFLWMMMCIPVFTIGASTAAMYRCMFKIKRDGSIKVFKTFFSVFREEFKQGAALGALYLLIIFILLADIGIIYFSGYDVSFIVQVVMCALTILAYLGLCYLFPVQAYFKNTIPNIIKNAWIIALHNLPYSIVIAQLHLAPVILLIVWPEIFIRSIIFWLLIGGSLIASISASLFVKVFKKYE